MEIKRIETLSKWLVLKQMIKDKGYTLWQMQYGWDNSEGFRIGYMKGDKRLEVITHNKDVADDIEKNL
jgi:exonuclease III